MQIKHQENISRQLISSTNDKRGKSSFNHRLDEYVGDTFRTILDAVANLINLIEIMEMEWF